MVLDEAMRTLKFLYEKDFLGMIKSGVIFIVVAAAFRNSLTWHLHNFWGASGEFWEGLYAKYYALCGNDHFTAGVFGLSAVTNLAFWLTALVFLVVDVTGRPQFILRYKVQPEENNPIPTDKLLKCLWVALYNQTVISLPFLCVAHYLFKLRGCPFDAGDLPTFGRLVVEAIGIIFIEEIGFYHGHRLLHNPRLYKHVHKIHHEWTAPIAAVTIYCHPLEHLLSNLIPAMTGPLVMGSHLGVSVTWAVAAQTVAMIHHCGYHLPLLPSPEAHDFHHLKFNYNFGVLGVLDRLYGTDALFLDSVQQMRHLTLLSLTPVTEIIAGSTKKQN